MYHLSPCIVALPNKRVQSDAAAAAGYRGENWLCNALRIEADFRKSRGAADAQGVRRHEQGSATRRETIKRFDRNHLGVASADLWPGPRARYVVP
jgi:hypothetical protein